MNTDIMFKVASVITSLIVIPLFGWVWSTNVDVKQISYEQGHSTEEVKELKQEVELLQSNGTEIKLLQKDIDFIKKEVKEISKFLKKP